MAQQERRWPGPVRRIGSTKYRCSAGPSDTDDPFVPVSYEAAPNRGEITMPDLAGDDVEALRCEVERFRALVGPDEMAYTELKLELWRVRDELIGMEAELGNARGARKLLERDLLVRDTEIANLVRQPAATHFQPGLTASLRKRVGALRDLKP